MIWTIKYWLWLAPLAATLIAAVWAVKVWPRPAGSDAVVGTIRALWAAAIGLAAAGISLASWLVWDYFT